MVSLSAFGWTDDKIGQILDILDATGQHDTIIPFPSDHGETLVRFRRLAHRRRDLDAYDAEMRQSQARRWIVREALRTGAYAPRDHQPLHRTSEQDMRNHMGRNLPEDNQRFPRGANSRRDTYRRGRSSRPRCLSYASALAPRLSMNWSNSDLSLASRSLARKSMNSRCSSSSRFSVSAR